jgi:uncharacterized Tic20 family protein
MFTLTKEERNWAMLSHLLALVGYFAIPFGNIIAPLIIYLVKKDESAFVADQARESLNFQISLSIYELISGFLVLILMVFVAPFGPFFFDSQVIQNPERISDRFHLFFITALICFFLLTAMWVLGLVLTIIATIKASNGKSYRYPMTIRLIR